MRENRKSSWLGCLGLLVVMTILGTMIRLGQWLANEGRSVLIILIVAIVAIAAYYAYSKYTKKQKAQHLADQEQQNHNEKLILKLAAEKKGYITAAEISLNSNLSLDDASKMLDDLKAKGACILRVSDNGTYVYQFDMLISQNDKLYSERI
ncbi:hypothetical protein BVG16_27595 [Paenibacillus selenitireducens]|uniref:Uncharacterized protein n=1 Tax=Paenibacillus selenitireducens TaxID=1324314 RepID=A0A1T2X126_9BACL|nr:hypothetical protein [Paenibacillus selenitireducens]OPA73580.1 hypothetical protein BVG16_27595 [Paenibacillus selenitireducens]